MPDTVLFYVCYHSNNNDSNSIHYYLLNIHHMPDTVLSVLCALSHLILSATL